MAVKCVGVVFKRNFMVCRAPTERVAAAANDPRGVSAARRSDNGAEEVNNAKVVNTNVTCKPYGLSRKEILNAAIKRGYFLVAEPRR